MSQRECAGFNAPRFSVEHVELLEVAPRAKAASADNAPFAWFGPPLLPSVALGVFQPANAACWLSGMPVSLGLAGRLPRVPSWAVCETQPANCATSLSGLAFLPC